MHQNDQGPLKIILASKQHERFAPIERGLWNAADTEFYEADSAGAVFEILKSKDIKLVIFDDTLADTSGLDVVRVLARQAPFVSCALVSDLEAEKFHHETEGLGVLMQLSEPLGEEAAKLLINSLVACGLLVDNYVINAGGEQ